MASTTNPSGTLKRSALAPLPPPLGTFRAPSAASSSSAASSLSPASVPPPMSTTGVIIPRPGILKTAPPASNTVIEFQNAVPHHPHPDVAQASGPVPNCSTTNRPTSILKHGQALPNTQETSGGGLGFNSSCQQCIAERAIVSGVNTVSKAGHHNEDQQHQLDITSGLEFTSLHSDSDGLTANGEETRGPRAKNPQPGRTYECEVWCREASRQLAGCLGFALLVLTYAALGGFLFMAIESRTAFKINEGHSSPEEQSGEPFLVEPPTVMNVTAAFMDMPKEVKANVEKARSETVAKLWRVTEQMNILYPDNWTRIASEEILWFQDQLTKALMLELTMAKKQKHQSNTKHKTQSRTQASQQYFYDHMQRPQSQGPFIKQPGEWTFGRGFLYSVSLLTTVGCGTDWAVSPLSRLLTVLYLLVGMPIMYLYLMSTGNLMARLIAISIRGLMCQIAPSSSNNSRANTNTSSRRSSANSSNGTPQHKHDHHLSAMEKLTIKNRSTWQTRSSLEASHRTSHLIHSSYHGHPHNIIMDLSKPSIAPPILASIFILMVYMMSGAAILAEAQRWSYNDALYYCFVSLFTIGFGGLRPEDPHMWVCALYILMGVTILSTCCHLLHQEVTSSLEKYKSVKRRNRILLTEIEAAKANSNSELS